jgi:hypothetical protein
LTTHLHPAPKTAIHRLSRAHLPLKMAFSQRNDVTQFLHSLQSADAAPADMLGEESFDFAMFTNTDFYDIDAGQTTSFNPQQSNPRRGAVRKQKQQQQQTSSHASPASPDDPPSTASAIDDFSGLDFPLAGELHRLPFFCPQLCFTAFEPSGRRDVVCPIRHVTRILPH